MSVYKKVTEGIIKRLEAGVTPWSAPWNATPRNIRGTGYRGINFFILSLEQALMGYSSPLWATFHQIKEKGGYVKKGEHGTTVVFWKKVVKEVEPDFEEVVKEDGDLEVEDLVEVEPEPETIEYVVARAYTVFNLDQTTLDWRDFVKNGNGNGNGFRPVERLEILAENYLTGEGIPLKEGVIPAYNQTLDYIIMPSEGAFESTEVYYTALFHEISHSTMAPKRLNRRLSGEDEELVAELSSAFIISEAGGIEIDMDEVERESSSYIGSWIAKMKQNSRYIFQIASYGQKSADYVLAYAKEGKIKKAA